MKKPIIEPSEVNLLVVDLDGTIHTNTNRGNKAIKRAYSKLDNKVDVTERTKRNTAVLLQMYFGKQ